MTSGQIDQSKTLAAWKRRTLVTRSALMEVKKEYLAEKQKIEADYKGEALKTRIDALNSDYREMVKIAMDRAEKDLEDVLKAKRKALSESQDAPSESMLRLLNAANMRTSITVAEINSMADKMRGNLPALAVLHDIATRNKVQFPSVSVENIDNDLENAMIFARERLSTMGQDLDSMDYKTRLFWCSDSGEAGYYFSRVDKGFTAALKANDNSDAGANAPSDVNKALNCTRVTLSGHENLVSIALQFGTTASAIQKINPDTDFSRSFSAGQQILIPSTRMKYSTNANAVSPGACEPAYSDLIGKDEQQADSK